MQIERIAHKGICPQDREIDLYHRTIMTGPVGSGKTTALRAVQMAFGLADPPNGAKVEVRANIGEAGAVTMGRNVVRNSDMRITKRQLAAIDPVSLGESASSAASVLAMLAEETIDRAALIARVKEIWPSAVPPDGSLIQWLNGLIETLGAEARSESAQSGQIRRIESGVSVEQIKPIVDSIRADLERSQRDRDVSAGILEATRQKLSGLPPLVTADVPTQEMSELSEKLDDAKEAAADLSALQRNTEFAFQRAEEAFDRANVALKKLIAEYHKLGEDALIDICPHCGQEWDGAALSAKQRQEALKPEIVAGRQAATEALAAKNTAWGELADANEKFSAGMTLLMRCKTARAACDGHKYEPARTSAMAEIKQFETKISEMDETIKVLSERLAEAMATLAAAKEAETVASRIEELKGSADAKRKAVIELQALQAGVATSRMGENMERLSSLMGAPCRLGAAVRGKAPIEVLQGDIWLPWSSLSDGQRIRFFLAFAVVLGGPARVIWIDRAECLGNELPDVLAMLSEQFDDGVFSQVVVSGHFPGGVAVPPGFVEVRL